MAWFLANKMIPYNYLRIEGDCPVYRRIDIEMFGTPDYWGVEKYLVVSSEEDIAPRVMDWKMGEDRRGSLRPVHRYDRVSRFRALLNDFMGHKTIPLEVLEIVRFWGLDKDKDEVYEGVRKVLKAYGYRKYYNSIASIIWIIQGNRKNFDYRIVDMVLEDFRRMSYKFDQMEEMDRVYFPNLRFVCLELLEVNGFEFGFKVNKIRTPRKKGVMEKIFCDLY